MNTWGICCIVAGISAIIRGLKDIERNGILSLLAGIGLVGLGIYLLNRAENKKQEKSDKDDWYNT